MSGIASGDIMVVRVEKWLVPIHRVDPPSAERVTHATYAEFFGRLGL